MPTTTTFDEVLDAIEHLPVDQQADLVEFMRRRRLAERGRRQVVNDVQDAEIERTEGRTRAASVEEIMRQIES